MISKKKAFTLIEVMVAVMITSVVIGALWKMHGNSTQKFIFLNTMQKNNPYATFLLGNSAKYGFEKSNIDMRILVDDFDLDSDLRQRLKAIKVKISYDVVSSLDDNESMILEVGKTNMEFLQTKLSLIRMRLQ